MPLPRTPNTTDLQAAQGILDLPGLGDQLIAQGRLLLQLGQNESIRSDPKLADEYVKSADEFRKAESAYTRAVGMVRVALQQALKQAPDAPEVLSAARKWQEVNGGLDGTGDRVPHTWTLREAVAIGMFLLAAVAFIAFIPVIVAAVGIVGAWTGIVLAAIATRGAVYVAVSASDRATIRTNIDAAAAGIEASPTLTQVASKGLSTLTILALVAGGLYALSKFTPTRRRR